MSVQNPRKKSLIEPLVMTAALSGIGLFWFLLSLAAIFCYEGVFDPPPTAPRRLMAYIMYYIYLDKSQETLKRILTKLKETYGSTLIIGPKEFNYFMYFYMILSFGLLVVSSVILWASITKKSEQFYKLRICIWTSVLTVLSLLDFILMCLIAHDYGQAQYILYHAVTPDVIAEATAISVAMGIVMTLAARGFLLWLLNVILIVIMGKHCYNLHKKDSNQPQTRPALDAFSTSVRPPWDQPLSPYAEPKTSGQQNKGFRDDDNNPMFSSFPHLSSSNRNNYEHSDRGNSREANPYINLGSQNISGNNNNNWDQNKRQHGMGGNNPLRPYSYQPERPMEAQWSQQAPLRTAKIGRQGGQSSPPLNVSTPYIPNPDYSPPGSPRVRGVLRPKSNYAMY